MAARLSVRFLSLRLAILSVFCSVTICSAKCPEHASVSSYGVDDDCLYLAHLEHDREALAAQLNYSWAFDECNGLEIGNLRWHLPKVDTNTKNADIYRRMIEHRVAAVRTSFVWIGLRRHGERTTDDIVWAESKYWLWTFDNTSIVSMKHSGKDFWFTNQPDNKVALRHGNLNFSEECVLGFPNTTHGNLRFYSYVCEIPALGGNETSKFDVKEVRALVCMATPEKVPIPIYERWWFYVICAALLSIAVSVLIFAGVMLYRYSKSASRRRRDKRKKYRDLSYKQEPKQPKKRPIFTRWYEPPIKSESLTSKSPISPKSPSKDSATLTSIKLDKGDYSDFGYCNLKPSKVIVPKVSPSSVAKKGAVIATKDNLSKISTTAKAKETKMASVSTATSKEPKIGFVPKQGLSSTTSKAKDTKGVVAATRLTSTTSKEPKGGTISSSATRKGSKSLGTAQATKEQLKSAMSKGSKTSSIAKKTSSSAAASKSKKPSKTTK